MLVTSCSTGPDEVDELQFENRTLAVRTKAAGDTKIVDSASGRIENLLRELSGKVFGSAERRLLSDPQCLREDDASFVALEASAAFC